MHNHQTRLPSAAAACQLPAAKPKVA